jgi:hypothetical protein
MSIDHGVASALTRIAAAFEQLAEAADRHTRQQADNQSQMLPNAACDGERNQQGAMDLPKDPK